jgi:hypothetical protein
VLYQLSRTAFIKGNYEKTSSLLDELGAKYPKGEYGRKATLAKEELQILKERLLEPSHEPNVSAEEPNRPQVKIKPVDVEELLKWLEEIRLEDESIRETMNEEEWRQFIEAIKAGQED